MSNEAITRHANAKLVANIFEADIPLISLLSSTSNKNPNYYIACAIPDEDGALAHYFAVFVARKHFVNYFNEQCDLRFLFTFASGRKYFTFAELPSDGKSVRMKEFQGEPPEEYLPDARFFASAHTSAWGLHNEVGVEQRIFIDGNWDMQEFGSFYQKFADIYSFEQALDYISSADQNRSAKIQTAFKAKPFRGGSSYTGFFSDLFDIIPQRERPSLEGIVYHSPGHVDLRGSDKILTSIQQSVSKFLDVADDLQKAHDDLRAFMSNAKLLSITGAKIVMDAETKNKLKVLTANFYSILPINGEATISKLTDGDFVVRAKIGLALFRRLKYTAHFFAQGRLAYS